MENMVHVYNGISFSCKEKLNGFIFCKIQTTPNSHIR